MLLFPAACPFGRCVDDSVPLLREKLQLLSLMEAVAPRCVCSRQVYRAPAHERALPFAAIAAACHVPAREVTARPLFLTVRLKCL